MAWFLDTNIIVFCLRGKSPVAMHKLHATPVGEVRIPAQVLAELLTGAEKSALAAKNRAKVQAFVAPFTIVWPSAAILDHYVSIRVELERIGSVISEADLWIAATARETGGILVTHNTGEFSRVPDLVIEDWTKL